MLNLEITPPKSPTIVGWLLEPSAHRPPIGSHPSYVLSERTKNARRRALGVQSETGGVGPLSALPMCGGAETARGERSRRLFLESLGSVEMREAVLLWSAAPDSVTLASGRRSPTPPGRPRCSRSLG
ncbi:hypothetical protein CDAR_263301 [Caerostris darwini]|uniref:Uncharacterized protein n=1 Tax=Caerostris darwini TaxID=1538125 RepID=A0AAV4RXQ1_9ARAC|nr:hypothetical protein CDAR_263301 [Caerostris darwini]